jgi:hypothetical protein
VEATRKLISTYDTDVYGKPKSEISQLIKNLATTDDAEKLKVLIDFDDNLLTHAIESLKTELEEVISQMAAQSKTIDKIEIPKHRVKIELLEELKVIANLKDLSFDSLKKRLEDEKKTSSPSERRPYPYAISYLITKLNDPAEQQEIRLLLDQLSIKYFNQ